MPSNRRRGSAASWLSAIAALLAGVCWSELGAQQPAPAPKPAEAKEPEQPAAPPESLDEPFELKPEQLARLQKLLPNALPKLQNRERLHIVALGDSVTRFVDHGGGHQNDTHRAYEGIFVAELAKLFFYTGGVRDIRPVEGQPAKVDDAAGPELTIENLALGGRVSRNALARITTDAFANKPSIMIVAYGVNDALINESLIDYLWPFERAAAIARARGCDPIFIGPNTTLGDGPDLTQMERTRPYASALESLAARLGVFYYDLGNVTSSGPGVPADQDDDEALIAYNEYVSGKYHTHADGTVDPLHPSETAHKLAGIELYDRLLADPVPKYRIGGFVTLDGKGGIRLEFKIKNLTENDVSGRVFTPNFMSFKAGQSSVPFTLRAGKGENLVATYKMGDGGGVYHIDGSEALLRIPILVADEKETHAHTINAAIHPFAPIWNLELRDGISDKAPGSFSVAVPPGAEGKAGTFNVAWNGTTDDGGFESGKPTAFAFPLPKPPAMRKRGSIELELKDAGGQSYRFSRALEVSRNFGLEQAVPMARRDKYAEGGGGGTGEVTFRAAADAQRLTLVYEIAMPLRRLGTTASPYFVEFHIDARAYGKRRTPGFTDFVRIIPLEDGAFKINALRPALFGDGYQKKLDRDQMKISRQPIPSGGERLTVSIPRDFFYLHEWALGNGNSQLGINTVVLAQNEGSTAENPFGDDAVFSLVEPKMSRFNAQALGVLELTERPTKRWSARFY